MKNRGRTHCPITDKILIVEDDMAGALEELQGLVDPIFRVVQVSDQEGGVDQRPVAGEDHRL